MANLHVLGEPLEDGGFGDEQLMRIMMLQARIGRRISEIRMLDREPLFALDRLTRPDGDEAADGAFVAKRRYQQTKIEQAPDTILADAEIVAIIRAQQQRADAHLGPHWAAGTTPKYLFLAHKMNRRADKPYPLERINQTLFGFARRLDIRDSAGRLVNFNRTHRFRHTKATSLLNACVPMHVVQRYFGHLSPVMLMHYAKTLAETHEREFLRYRKITADARELSTDPRDLYDMVELDKRTDRILPNGLCLLPPRQSCAKGNACLTCDKFATDATFLPELTTQRQRTSQLIEERQQAFTARTGQPMGEDNIWLAGRSQEQDPRPDHPQARKDPACRRAAPSRSRSGCRCPHRRHRPWSRRKVTSMRGNPDNLRQAAARKSAAAQARAEKGLREMIPQGRPITFCGRPRPPTSRSISSTGPPRSAAASNSSGTTSRTTRPGRP
ncbi:tyrosine-type recombinase/integrase [Streptomyces sp. NPDC048442]|uniref:tyrosine-type recombinase/integrase n=1 Tax=Streptomyces sp. NPDC048442 TaxID=3154823 RepID=UPI003443CAEB